MGSPASRARHYGRHDGHAAALVSARPGGRALCDEKRFDKAVRGSNERVRMLAATPCSPRENAGAQMQEGRTKGPNIMPATRAR